MVAQDNTLSLNNLKIGLRVTVGVVVPLVMLISVGVWSWTASDGVFRNVKEVRDERLQRMLLAQRLGKDLLQMQYFLTEVAINKGEGKDADVLSGAADYLEDFTKSLKEYETSYGAANNDKISKSVAGIRTHIGVFYEIGTKMAKAFGQDRQDEGFAQKEKFNESAELVSFDLEPLLRQEHDLAVVAMNDLVQQMARLRQGLLSIMLVAVALSALVGWLLVRSLVLPILTMENAMRVVSAGNLNHQVPVFGRDELSDMARIFNHMAKELAHTHSGLVSEKEKLSTIILSVREGIVVTDRQGVIVLVNPSAERLLRKTHDEIIGGGFDALVDDPEYIQAHLRGGTPPDVIVYKERVLSFYASAFYNDDKELVGSAALIRDVTAEKKLENKLRQLSETDGLTGLYNRRMFDESLVLELDRAERFKHPLSLLFFDVDHFKKFNDTHGHDQGDRVLQAIGQQMRDTLRNVDISCRYGGEEFVAILPATAALGATRSAERLRLDVEAMVVDNLKVTISVGVATYPDCGQEVSGEELLKLADNALYHAKRAGRNCVQVATQLAG